MPDRCRELMDELVARRKAVGMTQQELAKATGLTQSVIARYERKGSVPQLDSFLKIAGALNWDIEFVPLEK